MKVVILAAAATLAVCPTTDASTVVDTPSYRLSMELDGLVVDQSAFTQQVISNMAPFNAGKPIDDLRLQTTSFKLIPTSAGTFSAGGGTALATYSYSFSFTLEAKPGFQIFAGGAIAAVSGFVSGGTGSTAVPWAYSASIADSYNNLYPSNDGWHILESMSVSDEQWTSYWAVSGGSWVQARTIMDNRWGRGENDPYYHWLSAEPKDLMYLSQSVTAGLTLKTNDMDEYVTATRRDSDFSLSFVIANALPIYTQPSLPSPIPEPSQALMLAAGILVIRTVAHAQRGSARKK